VCLLLESFSWQNINICLDSLSVLIALKNAEYALFPKAVNKLNIVLADLSYKISRINFAKNRIRFTWCPAHVGFSGNERADFLAKAASVNGEEWNNCISCREIFSFLSPVYMDFNSAFFHSEIESGSYFLKNFSDTNLNLVRKFSKRSEDCKLLTRIVTGFPKTNSYLFKLNVVTSPGCRCGAEFQNLNHFFWACPLLTEEKRKLFVLLRSLNLFDPFSIEYLIGNINKKIGNINKKNTILLRFAGIANLKLNISL